MSTEPAKKII